MDESLYPIIGLYSFSTGVCYANTTLKVIKALGASSHFINKDTIGQLLSIGTAVHYANTDYLQNYPTMTLGIVYSSYIIGQSLQWKYPRYLPSLFLGSTLTTLSYTLFSSIQLYELSKKESSKKKFIDFSSISTLCGSLGLYLGSQRHKYFPSRVILGLGMTGYTASIIWFKSSYID